MSRLELFAFVFAHTDNCPACSNAEFCDKGKELIDRAAQLGAELLVPDYPIEKPKAQA